MASRPTTPNIPTLGDYATPVPLTEQPMTNSRAYIIETPIPQTAVPRFVDSAPPQPPKESTRVSVLTAVSMLIGILLGLAAIMGGLGKAFYVEKDSYTQDKIKALNDLNTITSSLSEVSSSMRRLEAAVNALSAEVKEMRETPQRKR